MGQYESAIQLLRNVEVDYRRARRELEEVSSHFGDREATARSQLIKALEAADQVATNPPSLTCENVSQQSGRHAQRVKGSAERPAPGESPAIPSIEVYCLGTFQVRIGTKRVVRWPSLKARSLLGYLVAEHGRPLPKELLMEILWPGCEPALANNNLKAAVRALRQTLASIEETEEPFMWILFQDGSYMINPDADIWCDVDQFEYHWATAIKLEKQERQPEAMREHETAEALYRGDYLEDNPYEDWTTLRREALKDTYLAILSRLAEYAMTKSDHLGCIAYCQRILRKDPCREDAYQRLMVCYARLGQRSRAIGWYRICEKTLKNELEVSPDRQTARMYHRILNGEEI